MSNDYSITRTFGFAIPMEHYSEKRLEELFNQIESLVDEDDFLAFGESGSRAFDEVKPGREYFWVGAERLTSSVDLKESDGFLWRDYEPINAEEEASLRAIAEALEIEDPTFDFMISYQVD